MLGFLMSEFYSNYSQTKLKKFIGLLNLLNETIIID